MQEGNNETNRPIRVLLADDHTLFRQGLEGLLAAYGGLEIIAEVLNDGAALTLAEEEKPDVVVMQVQIPFERSKESLRKMREISPPPKVVIVTMFEEPRYVRGLMELGASAYLLKSVSVEHLLGAVRAAVFDPEGHHVVVGRPRRMIEEVEEGSGGILSVREMEVLVLVARGLSNHQIASSLMASEATVKRHLARRFPEGQHSSAAPQPESPGQGRRAARPCGATTTPRRRPGRRARRRSSSQPPPHQRLRSYGCGV